jgi:serine/threonine protein kinase
MMDRIGQQFGNYRLTRLLGEGGFAAVYLGEHIHLNTQVAIKILTTKLIDQEVEQFRHEAYLLAHLNHPNIVRVLDFGLEERESLPFLVMQYASHGTLRQQYPKGSIVPFGATLAYVKQVAAALHYAHSNRIIHRDVKPENMLIGDQNEILLSDFGIALLTQTSQEQKTQELIGTASYMSPEQIRGKPQPASDQYALGIVVYEWLCGTSPFQGSFLEVCSQHTMAAPPPLRQRVPTISQEVEQVVTRALAKDPKERFSTIQGFATALAEAVEGRTRSSADVSFTPNAPQIREGRARSSADVPTTSNVTIDYVQSRDEKAAPRHIAQEYTYVSQNISGRLQEPFPSTRQQEKGRRGLLVGIITAVLIFILGSGGTFAVLNISNRLHVSATPTSHIAPATPTSHIAPATPTSHIAPATATVANAALLSGICYQAHVQNIGWQGAVCNSQQAGTTGQNLRMEALRIWLVRPIGRIGVCYQAHVQNVGWQPWVCNGQQTGTTGQNLRMEALRVILVHAPAHWNICYQAHMQNIGWQGQVCNGQQAGTTGQNLRMEAVQIFLVRR